MPAHTYCTLADSKHTINFAFNNLWRGDGSRSLSIFIAKGGRWEDSTWKCKAPYFSSNTACYMESKGTKQPSLPTANIRAALSDACITRTGRTIQRHSVSKAMLSDVFITSHDLYMILSSFVVHYDCICKRGRDVQDQTQLCQSIQSVFSSISLPTFLFLCHLFVCLYPSPS